MANLQAQADQEERQSHRIFRFADPDFLQGIADLVDERVVGGHAQGWASGENQTREWRVGAPEVRHELERKAGQLARFDSGFESAEHFFKKFAACFSRHCSEGTALVFEIEVESARCNASAAGDLSGGRPIVAAFEEDLFGCCDEGAFRFFPAGRRVRRRRIDLEQSVGWFVHVS